MIRRAWLRAGLAIAAALAPLSTGAHAASGIGDIAGTWINPHGSVKVVTGDCGGRLCGWISWVNAEAMADAQASGITRLIGTELLRNYHATDAGRWQGEVYVPDMGRTFYSTIDLRGHDRLRISGCILGGFICKSQIWQRA
ncbi:MAG: DUF2147 domain-containing protein [Sphingomonas sp.]|nr:DUF2147 domain-containing protein [Sphingomonas sp.]MDX3882806.1 DUF2147 domain-containing protein [Sphingomonas sp.]